MKYYYHGSFTQHLTLLEPFGKRDNTVKKPVVYLTPNPYLSLFYIWNRPYKFVTFEEDKTGKFFYTEWFENQLYDFYHQVSGSVYVCNADTPSIHLSHIKGVYISDTAVEVEKEFPVDNVYAHILEQAEKGNIFIKKHDELSDDERRTIQTNVIRSIHMQHLLSDRNSEYAAFIRKHFPFEWQEAIQMDEEQIKAMINEWKNSLK